MNAHRTFLLIIGIVALLSLISGIYNVSQGNFSGVAWPFVWLGIFIWGDGIVLGTFLFLAAIGLWLKNNPAFTGMLFSGYAALRSFIEIMYNLNAQFATAVRPWDSPAIALASFLHLTPTEVFVLPQIFYTAICLLAVLIFISYLKKYLRA